MDRARDPRPGAGSALSTRQRWAHRLRRWLRPPRTLRPTRAGWGFFALTFGVGFAALNTGNNLLYMLLALQLAFLVLSGVLSEAALRRIEVRRRLPPELEAGRPTRIVLEVRNAQRRVSSFALVVEDLVGRDLDQATTAGRAFVLRLDAGQRELRSYALRPERRGPLHFVGFRVSTRFPFGMFSKALRLESTTEALVFPHLDRDVALAWAGGPAGRLAEALGSAGGDAPEAAGLREWAPGDPARRVHWRASQRRRNLVVRDQEREPRGELTVHLRSRGVSPGPAFEAEVSRAASQVHRHLAAGFRVGLATDHASFLPEAGAAQRKRLLAHLARIEAEPSPLEAAA